MDLEQRIIELEREVIETRKAATNLLVEIMAASDGQVHADLVARLNAADTSPEGKRIQRLVTATVSGLRH